MPNPGLEAQAALQVVNEHFVPTPVDDVLPTNPVLQELDGMERTRRGIEEYGVVIASLLHLNEGSYLGFIDRYETAVAAAKTADEALKEFIANLEPRFNVRLDVLIAETQESHAEHQEVRAGKLATDAQRHDDVALIEQAQVALAAQESVTAETQAAQEAAETKAATEQAQKQAAYNAKLQAAMVTEVQSMRDLEDMYARRYDNGPELVADETLEATATAQAAHQAQMARLEAAQARLHAAREQFFMTSEQNVRYEQRDRLHFEKGPEWVDKAEALAADYAALRAELDELFAAAQAAHQAVSDCTPPQSNYLPPFGEWQQASEPDPQASAAAPRHAAAETPAPYAAMSEAESSDDRTDELGSWRRNGQVG